MWIEGSVSSRTGGLRRTGAVGLEADDAFAASASMRPGSGLAGTIGADCAAGVPFGAAGAAGANFSAGAALAAAGVGGIGSALIDSALAVTVGADRRSAQLPSPPSNPKLGTSNPEFFAEALSPSMIREVPVGAAAGSSSPPSVMSSAIHASAGGVGLEAAVAGAGLPEPGFWGAAAAAGGGAAADARFAPMTSNSSISSAGSSSNEEASSSSGGSDGFFALAGGTEGTAGFAAALAGLAGWLAAGPWAALDAPPGFSPALLGVGLGLGPTSGRPRTMVETAGVSPATAEPRTTLGGRVP
jgi:hypothetical protein